MTDEERALKFVGDCTGVGAGVRCSWCPNCKRYDALREAFLAVRADGFSQGVATEREACARVVREVAKRPRTDPDVVRAACVAFDEAEAEIRERGQS